MAAQLQDAIAGARIESDLLKDRIQAKNARLADTSCTCFFSLTQCAKRHLKSLRCACCRSSDERC